MKITLISTACFPSDQGIRTISAVLKKTGHEVKLVFMALPEDYSINYSLKELRQLARLCKSAELIGISSYASAAHRARRIIKFLKKHFPEKPFVYGGVHATISPDLCIQDADIVCVGEGEGAILDLTKALEKNKSINKINNLWIRDKKTNEIIKNQVRRTVDIYKIIKGKFVENGP